MADVVGRGVIELVADARQLKASIEDAKKSIRTLGEGQKDISAAASQSIDKYIGRLNTQNATIGKSARETELFKLALRGASDEQLKTADGALRLAEAHARNATSINALKTGFIALGAIAATSLIAAAAAFDNLVKKAGSFQDMGEKVGDTAENMASLAVAAAVGGAAMETVVAASAKLTKGLTGVDDESKAAGAAIEALGLNITTFKALAPADQFETVAKALAGFEDGAQKTAVAIALFGKAGAEMLPFLKELGQEGGRQSILTAEQIRLSDEYSDAQKRLQTQIGLHAQAIAADLLPQLTALKAELFELVKGYEANGQASTILQDAFETGVTLFKIIAVAAANTAFVFLAVGREIGAIAAQLAALARLDFNGFTAISDAVKEDAARARAEIDELTKRLMKVGTERPTETAADRDDAESGARFRSGPKKKLNFEGALKKDTGAAAAAALARAEAAAQLAFDLDQIKKASDATTGMFSNAEKIMEALRSAALVDERDYYESRRGFITANAAVQEKALQDQIARLEKETFTGKTAAKDQIDNDRAVLALKAQIAKLREDAAANITVTAIQEAAANAKVKQSLEEATIASNAYIRSVERRNARELEGLGRGGKFREEQSGLGAIEDTLQAQRQKLEGELRRKEITDDTFASYLKVAQDTYAKEVALYLKRTAAINASAGDWMTGAREALNNYLDEARDIAKQTEAAFTNAFRGLEDVLVDFVKTGKLNFKSLVDQILSDFARMAIKKNITGPLAELFLGAISGAGVDMFTPTMAGGGRLSAGEMALVGERGPELFRPDTAGTVIPNGAFGGGNVTMVQHIHFSANSPAAVRDAVFAAAPQIADMAVSRMRDQRNRTGDQR